MDESNIKTGSTSSVNNGVQKMDLESGESGEGTHPTSPSENAEEGRETREASDSENKEKITTTTTLVRIIVSVMLVATGSINTLAAKWADVIHINGRYFQHPFFQATVMFVGEMCCMAAYLVYFFIMRQLWKRRHRESFKSVKAEGSNEAVEISETNSEKKRSFSFEKCSSESDDDDDRFPTIPRFNYFLFAAPACCDVVATSLQYVGLTLTSASSYQMLRGAVIIFTGVFSMICLHTKLYLYRWVGMVLVVIGLVIVGVADIYYSKDTNGLTKQDILVGDIIIVLSQIVVAIQMVVEQRLLYDCSCPALLAVGLEGIVGFSVLSVLMVPMYFIHVPAMFSDSPEHRLEDALDAFHEMGESGQLVGALLLTVVSIAFFNFSGLSVTKYMSATTRMVLDSVRTIVIWALSIPLFHAQFIPIQILGFVFLVFGMFVYNDVFFGPNIRRTNCGKRLFPTTAS